MHSWGSVTSLDGAESENDRPSEHHGMVFVGQVVAVTNVFTQEGPEIPIEYHFLAGVERHHVLLRLVIRMCVNAPFTREDLMLLHVNMEWMDPPTATVLYGPDLGHTALRRGERDEGIKGKAVDQPFDLGIGRSATTLQRERTVLQAIQDRRRR